MRHGVRNFIPPLLICLAWIVAPISIVGDRTWTFDGLNIRDYMVITASESVTFLIIVAVVISVIQVSAVRSSDNDLGIRTKLGVTFKLNFPIWAMAVIGYFIALLYALRLNDKIVPSFTIITTLTVVVSVIGITAWITVASTFSWILPSYVVAPLAMVAIYVIRNLSRGQSILERQLFASFHYSTYQFTQIARSSVLGSIVFFSTAIVVCGLLLNARYAAKINVTIIGICVLVGISGLIFARNVIDDGDTYAWEPRTDEITCRVDRGLQICLWNESENSREVVVETISILRDELGKRGVEIANKWSVRYRDKSDGFIYFAPYGKETVVGKMRLISEVSFVPERDAMGSSSCASGVKNVDGRIVRPSAIFTLWMYERLRNDWDLDVDDERRNFLAVSGVRTEELEEFALLEQFSPTEFSAWFNANQLGYDVCSIDPLSSALVAPSSQRAR